MTLTRDELVEVVRAALDERLCVEEPPPFGRNLAVTRDLGHEARVLVLQPGGQHFAVTVAEATFEVAT